MGSFRLVCLTLLVFLGCKRTTPTAEVKEAPGSGDQGAAVPNDGAGEEKEHSPAGDYAREMAPLIFNPPACPQISEEDAKKYCDEIGCTVQELTEACTATSLRLLETPVDPQDLAIEEAVYAATFPMFLEEDQKIIADMGDLQGGTGTGAGTNTATGTDQTGDTSANTGTQVAGGNDGTPGLGFGLTKGFGLTDPAIPDEYNIAINAVAAALDAVFNPNAARAARWTIPVSTFRPLFYQLLQGSTYGAGFGIAGSISATVVGKSLALEEILLPPNNTTDDLTLGFYCNTSLSLTTPELAVGANLYGIKTFGCQEHNEYAGDSVGVSFGLGVPLAYGSVGGTLGGGFSVDYTAMVRAFRANAAGLAQATINNQTGDFALFLAKYATDKAGQAGKLIAASAVGGMVGDLILQNGARARPAAPAANGLSPGMQRIYDALKAVVDGINQLSKAKLMQAAIQDVIDNMTAYEAANRVSLSGPKALAAILKDTITCGAITAGVSGSIGLGTREDTPSPVSFGAAATIAKAHLLLQLSPPDIRGLLDGIVSARRNAQTALQRSRQAAQDLSAAIVDRDFIQNLVSSLNSCIEANTRFGITPPPFVVICMVRSGYAEDLARQALSGNIVQRLQRLQSAVGNARQAANATAATAQVAVGLASNSARDLASQVVRQLGAIARASARCAVDTATVPFATTIYDAATSGQ